MKVSKIMTLAPLVVIDLNASTREAEELMQKHSIRRLPVMKEGTLGGIVTSKDLLMCVR